MVDIISKIDELLEKPCYLIDMFPSTVPKAADQRYFDVEEYFQNHREALDEKFCRILLKLYCYHDFWISAGNENMKNPSVNQLVELIRHCFAGSWKNRDDINIILPGCDAMVILNGDDLYMILCNPDPPLQKLVSQLAAAEGLFFYQAPER